MSERSGRHTLGAYRGLQVALGKGELQDVLYDNIPDAFQVGGRGLGGGGGEDMG
jgi:hypothetical protein